MKNMAHGLYMTRLVNRLKQEQILFCKDIRTRSKLTPELSSLQLKFQCINVHIHQ